MFVRLIRKVHSLKHHYGRSNNDSIQLPSKACIKRPQVLGSLCRATQSQTDMVPIHGSAHHCAPPLLGAQLSACRCRLKDAPCHCSCCLGFWFFWGGLFFFSFLSFNYTVQSGSLSSGDVAGWLQVGGGVVVGERSYWVGELGVCLCRRSSSSCWRGFVTLISYTLTNASFSFRHTLPPLPRQTVYGLQWCTGPIAPLRWAEQQFTLVLLRFRLLG